MAATIIQLRLQGVDCGRMVVSGVQDAIRVETFLSPILNIARYTTASEKVNPVVALHTVSNGTLCFKLSPLSDHETDWVGVILLHSVLTSDSKV